MTAAVGALAAAAARTLRHPVAQDPRKPSAALLAPETGRRTRRAITSGVVLVLLLVFAFSYGNITGWGLSKHLPVYLAVLLSPTLDITVLALIAGLRYLSLSGVAGRRLLPARLFLIAGGVGTWALNTAGAWSNGKLGPDLSKVALDSIAPGLLIAWGEALPWFLRLFHEVAAREAAVKVPPPAPVGAPPAVVASPVPALEAGPSRDAPPTPARATSRSRSRPGQPSRTAASTSTTARMRAHARDELAAGREPEGTAVARRFGADPSLGRRAVREARAERAGQALAAGNGHVDPAGPPADGNDHPTTTVPPTAAADSKEAPDA